MRFVIDIETTNLLQNGLDYDTMPYQLKNDYKVHCIVIRHADSAAVKTLVGSEITKDALAHALRKCTEIIGHNIVAFDLPVLALYGVLDYNIAFPGKVSTVFGKPCAITDTLLWSKLLNADRFGGHSLDAWGKRLGNYKTDFNDWSTFSTEMLEYCIQDTAVNVDIYKELVKEQGTHDWTVPYSMEIKLADLTLKQEMLGFAFDMDLAEKNLQELTQLMQDIAVKVNPILPPKKMSKVDASYYMPPKIKFKKDGTISAIFQKFLDKLGASLHNKEIHYKGQVFPVTTIEPLKSYEPATIEDMDVVKGYLLSLGWEPSEVKERDITKNADKTVKKVPEILAAVERYIKQTESSLFRQLRLDHLGVSIGQLRQHLLNLVQETKPQVRYNKAQPQKPIFLPTTPKLTVGVEKDICPNLIKLGDKADFVKDVVHYYTYRHRKNSIAGGGVDEDGDPVTGFVSAVRSDGRIPTPADTLGANTGRYRHRLVCNVPRVTSLYGENMRNLFGCGTGLYQLGFDFASLEARIMGHYVLPYKNGEALAEALVAEKPNDIHSINARKLGIDRSSAKSFSYAAIYGAQPKKLSKMLSIPEEEGKRLFNEYWEAVPALKELKEQVEADWEQRGKKHILGLDGRLLNTRSKHSLINVLFQSGGAIAAKWSTVLIAQVLEEQGILGNPFIHTTKDVKVWLLIAYHDECQFAVHPSLMQVHVCSSEEEAKTMNKTVENASAVGHGAKGYYVGLPTGPVEAISNGIKQACSTLKLSVDLGFEWIPGKTWGQCH